MPTSGWAEGWRRQRGDASDQANGREEDVQATQGTSAGGRRRKRRGRRWPMPGAARAQLADGGRTVKVATGKQERHSRFKHETFEDNGLPGQAVKRRKKKLLSASMLPACHWPPLCPAAGVGGSASRSHAASRQQFWPRGWRRKRCATTRLAAAALPSRVGDVVGPRTAAMCTAAAGVRRQRRARTRGISHQVGSS